jgi:tetratricopeptide (TPR) repeat protein
MNSSPPLPTVCLNMIVKNESKVIERLLSSVVNLIDTYCIEDTGSTDNTIELITQFFKEKGIPGKIVEEPFRNFAYNRTHAFRQAEGMADYLLLIDADMIFTHTLFPNEIRGRLAQHEVFYVFQGSNSFYYKNVRFAKNNPDSKYITPTHEYFAPPAGSTYGIFDKTEVFIDDRGDGGSKENKANRDIKLLTAELEIIGDKGEGADRCYFYLGNSYRDSGDTEKAIECYKKRIAIGGWAEEVWHSFYEIGNICKKQGKTEEAIFYWMEAFEKQPMRVESLYKIIEYYRQKSSYKTAQFFWKLADKLRTEHTNWGEYLFLHSDVYEYLLDYEKSLFGYYTGDDYGELGKSIMKVISHRSVANYIFDNCLKNYKFYSPTLVDFCKGEPAQRGFNNPHNYNLLMSIGKDLMKNDVENGGFSSSTPSVALMNDHTMVVCVRYVNYTIGERGEYINQSNIITKNVFAVVDMTEDEWKLKKEAKVLSYDQTMDNIYVGLEDVRIFPYFSRVLSGAEKVLLYNANRGLSYNNIAIEHGSVDLEEMKVNPEESGILKMGDFSDGGVTVKQSKIEKNWVLFQDGYGLRCVYGWSPLVVGKITPEFAFEPISSATKVNNGKLPKFFDRVRGSTNGVNIPNTNEVWFLCHVVSYEDGRRYYYHLFIVLDKTTYRVMRYTRLFTFSKEKVEYTTGFVYMQRTGEFLIGFSKMDRMTDYVTLYKEKVDKLFLQV